MNGGGMSFVSSQGRNVVRLSGMRIADNAVIVSGEENNGFVVAAGLHLFADGSDFWIRSSVIEGNAAWSSGDRNKANVRDWGGGVVF